MNFMNKLFIFSKAFNMHICITKITGTSMNMTKFSLLSTKSKFPNANNNFPACKLVNTLSRNNILHLLLLMFSSRTLRGHEALALELLYHLAVNIRVVSPNSKRGGSSNIYNQDYQFSYQSSPDNDVNITQAIKQSFLNMHNVFRI